jgi:sigma-B regulation protein RsbQ
LSLSTRHNAQVRGDGDRAMVFAHGFGCDQNMWRYVAPAFEDRFRTVLFDHIGSGGSDLSAYDPDKYASLSGYADDVVELCRELGIRGGVYVGHSVSAMIGVLAAKKAPELFDKLVLVGPSPCYIDDGEDYVGGFTEAQIQELLDFLDSNHMGWSQAMAPVIMGNSDRPELGEELTNSFCRTDPEIAKSFARATFLSDNREDLKAVPAHALVLQCSDDVIAPQCVGEYVHRSLPGSEFVLMKATGHCPNLSAPEETIAAIRAFV